MNTPSLFDRARRRELSSIATQELGGLMPPHISIRGNRFAYVDAAGLRYPVPTLHLDVILLDANPHKSKTYYPDKFDPNAEDFAPPLCFSDNGTAPSANAQEPQARTCAECVHNEWGSAINELTGKRRKACSDRKKLAMLAIDDTSGMVYQLQIPPATLSSLVTYAGQLGAMKPPGSNRKADINDVVTRVTFVDGKNGELAFQAIAWLTSVMPGSAGGWIVAKTQQGQIANAPDGGLAVFDAVDNLLDSGVTDEICGRLDRPWQGAITAQPQQVTAQPVQLSPGVATVSTSYVPPQQQPAAVAGVQQLRPQQAITVAPQQAATGHGGRRPGSGRKPAAKPDAAVPAATGVQALATPPMEVYAPGQAIPAQQAPQALQPATPVPLTMTPEQMLNSNSGGVETPMSPKEGLNPPFAASQAAASDIERALDMVRGLPTG